MPYFTEHGTLGGIIYFVVLRLILLVLGAFAMSWWVWGIILIGFWIGARPDVKAIRTNGEWKPWLWRRDDAMYYRTHYGDIAAWYMKRWYQVWPIPFIIHIRIDRLFHNGMSVDRNANWWFGELLHLILNAFLIVLLMVWENS